MYHRHILGKEGEDVAVQYLREHGYKILERNFSCRQGEIDIIGTDGQYIIFFEIKSRSNIKYGLPAESVTKKKIEHILKTAKYYLYKENIEERSIRIDVIEVFIKNGTNEINHIKQVI